MTSRIRTTGSAYPRIVDTSVTLPRLEPSEVAAALGGEPCAVGLKGAMGPITLYALRQEIFKRLQSTGGQPEAAETTPSGTIALSDQQWRQLEQLAVAASSPELTLSAEQVAKILLTLALNSVTAQMGKSTPETSGAPVAKELAAIAATEAKQGT